MMDKEFLMALLAGAAKNADGVKLELPVFENEIEALRHAARLAALAPGAVIYARNEGCAPQKSVFMRWEGQGKCARMFYDPKDNKTLSSCATPVSAIFFEDQITDEMRALPPSSF